MSAWQVVAHRSVKGASHERSGVENQDSAESGVIGSGTHRVLFAVVADGHGSAKYVRSDRGASLATRAVREFLSKLGAGEWPETIQRDLPFFVARNWLRWVESDRLSRPVTEQELLRLADAGVRDEVLVPLVEDSYDLDAQITPQTVKPTAYGSTILGVVAYEGGLLLFQLGDGDIVTIGSKSGAVHWRDLKPEGMVGTETTSLSMPAAETLFKTRLVPEPDEEDLPFMVFVSTDGYANSYATDEVFLKAPLDIYDRLCRDGVDAVANHLETWLRQTTAEGSGDDISVAILVKRSSEQVGLLKRWVDRLL